MKLKFFLKWQLLFLPLISLLLTQCCNKSSKKQALLFGALKFDKSGRELTIKQAKNFVAAYTTDATFGKPVLLEELSRDTISSFRIDTAVLHKIDTLPDFSGIRVYFALRGYNSNKEPIYTLVIVPTGKEYTAGKNQNILKDNYIFDWTEPCPTNCPDGGTDLK